MGQVCSLDELINILPSLRKGRKVVFTNGCFDLLHVGHIRYLKEARALGDILVVALNSDASVKRLKGSERPVQNQEDRAEILSSLADVDFVVLFSEDVPTPTIEKIKPDILVKGGDWPVEKMEGAKFVMSYGGKAQSLKFHKGRSTSSLIEKILKTT